MEDVLIFAYLAGAMDSDGYFSIKKSTYHRRVRKDAVHPIYSEKMGLKQVTPDVPKLLYNLFGGYFRIEKAPSGNSKPLFSITLTDKNAEKACKALLPYLRIKHRQAETLLELRESKQGKYSQASYWFVKEYPDWHKLEMITNQEAAKILGFANTSMVSQSIRNGTLVSLPYDYSGKVKPRIPFKLVDILVNLKGKHGYIQPPQLIKWKEKLFNEIRELNKIGINGTPIYYRKGVFKPID